MVRNSDCISRMLYQEDGSHDFTAPAAGMLVSSYGEALPRGYHVRQPHQAKAQTQKKQHSGAVEQFCCQVFVLYSAIHCCFSLAHVVDVIGRC